MASDTRGPLCVESDDGFSFSADLEIYLTKVTSAFYRRGFTVVYISKPVKPRTAGRRTVAKVAFPPSFEMGKKKNLIYVKYGTDNPYVVIFLFTLPHC